MEHPESHVLRKEACPKCGSRDNLARYSDGHAHCFSQGCGHRERGDGEAAPTPSKNTSNANLHGYPTAQVEGLKDRNLSEETCRKFGVRVGEFKGKKAHYYPYFADGQVVAAKVRMAGKDFTFAGEPKKAGLFGMNLWPTGGRKIVVTEGELDALSVSQIQGNKYPVVSIPNGAGGAKKDLAKNLEYLNGFEEVILMFDMDKPGRDAMKECAELFPPGKCKLAELPLKDPNDCLRAGRGDAVIQAIWNAKPYRPDGLVTIFDLKDKLDAPIESGLPWFLPLLTKYTYGRRWGEVYGLGAGTGIGKTDFFTQQIAFDIVTLKQKVGLIFLEQQPTETVIRVAGKLAGKRFHVPDGSWTQEERNLWIDKLAEHVVLYDSFGQTEWEVIAAKIRFMAVSEGIRIFYVDHLTAMADTADEKASLEQIMKEMAGLANELKVIITFISHLSTPEGKSHEEGGHVAIRHFKGSRAIGFWSFFMFGMERDQQHPDPVIRGLTRFRILKDRYTGSATGEVIWLGYDRKTGLLFETEAPPEGDKQSKGGRRAPGSSFKNEDEIEDAAIAF